MTEIPPSSRLFRLILGVSIRLRGLMDAQLAEIDLTTQQAALLTIAAGLEPPLTQGELAVRLGTSHQNVRQLLDVLVRKGLVAVEVDAADRRVRRVRCTDAVAATFADRDERDHAAVRDWLGALSDAEVLEAARLLELVGRGLDQRDGGA
jgi:DNA-binding MarR family transcriptional regulator